MDFLVRYNPQHQAPSSENLTLCLCSAEVFPLAVRSVALVFTTCVQWLGQFIIVYSTPYMMKDITYGTFLFFGSFLVVGMAVVYIFMPETKGFSLEEMDILFGVKGMAGQKRHIAKQFIAEQRAAEALVMDDKRNVSHVEDRANLEDPEK